MCTKRIDSSTMFSAVLWSLSACVPTEQGMMSRGLEEKLRQTTLEEHWLSQTQVDRCVMELLLLPYDHAGLELKHKVEAFMKVHPLSGKQLLSFLERHHQTDYDKFDHSNVWVFVPKNDTSEATLKRALLAALYYPSGYALFTTRETSIELALSYHYGHPHVPRIFSTMGGTLCAHHPMLNLREPNTQRQLGDQSFWYDAPLHKAFDLYVIKLPISRKEASDKLIQRSQKGKGRGCMAALHFLNLLQYMDPAYYDQHKDWDHRAYDTYRPDTCAYCKAWQRVHGSDEEKEGVSYTEQSDQECDLSRSECRSLREEGCVLHQH